MKGLVLMLAGTLIGFTLPLIGGITVLSGIEALLLAASCGYVGYAVGDYWDEEKE